MTRRNIDRIINLVICFIMCVSFVGDTALAKSNFTEQPRGFNDPYFKAFNGSEFLDNDCSTDSSAEDNHKEETSGINATDQVTSKEYFEKFGEYAVNVGRKYRIPYTIILAQSAIESGWGKSELSAKYNNFFGIKDAADWKGKTVPMQASNGVKEHATWRWYDNPEEGFKGYGEFIYRNDRYHKAWEQYNNPKQYIQEVYNAGYGGLDQSYPDGIYKLSQEFEKLAKEKNDDEKFPDVNNMKYDEDELADTVKKALSGGTFSDSDSSDETKSDVGGEKSKGSGGTCCTKSKTTISGSNNVEKALSYFMGKGFTGAQAAGILGNLMQESGPELNPDINEISNPVSGSYGIAQWLGSRRQHLYEYADKQGKDHASLELQLEYLGMELGIDGDTSDSAYGAYKEHIDEIKRIEGNDKEAVSRATKIFQDKIEVGMGFEPRYKYALQVFEKYGSDPNFKSGETSGGTCEGNSVANGDLVYYNQNDPKWASSGLPIAGSGCGPTSISMIVAGLVDKNVTPPDVAEFLQSKGTWSSAGIVWTGFEQAGEKWGLKVTAINPADKGKIVDALKSGKVMTVSGTGSAPFTSGGHIVVGKGITSDDKIIISNPAPGTNKNGKEEAEYSYEELVGAGLAAAWVYEK